MKDPEFLAEAKKSKLDIDAISGEEIQALVEEGYRTPRDVAKKVGALIR
jgi:hypothetical protein